MEQLTPFLSVSLAIVSLLLLGTTKEVPEPIPLTEFYEMNESAFIAIQSEETTAERLRQKVHDLIEKGKARQLSFHLTETAGSPANLSNFKFLGTLVPTASPQTESKTIVVFSVQRS